MAQVSVENHACPLRYSAVLRYLKLTIHKNNFHCLSEVKERLEGPKYNIDFGEGRGGGRQGKGIGKSTIQKGAILRKCLNTFFPHCRFLKCPRFRGWAYGFQKQN